MKQEEEALLESLKNMLHAIDMCFQLRLYIPGLILIYSTIDTLSWLSTPPERPNVTRHDFCSWVDKYLIPTHFVECTAIDLYAARCGLLHTNSPQSDLSRTGKAREIWYVWGGAPVSTLDEHIAKQKRNATPVHVDDLFNALKKALQDYAHHLADRSAKLESASALRKARKLFSNVKKLKDV